MYLVKEIFYSVQGEGHNSGTPAIFVRFSGCNLWSGKSSDRAGAKCKFCDTDFVGVDGENGGVYSVQELTHKINDISSESGCRFIVITGGEPLLQLDEKLVSSLKNNQYFVSVESNGTIETNLDIDWLTISPKFGTKLIQTKGDELKLVYPQEDIMNPNKFENLDFKHFYLQPKDTQETNTNIQKTLDYCLKNPKWKISIQIHKILDVK